MADLWLPGATRVPGNNGLIQGAGGGKGRRLFTWHSFEAPYTYSPDGVTAARYLNAQGSTAHFIFHPTTGALVQLLPANQAARTLRVNGPDGFHDVNRHGDVHMQVEVIAFASRPFTADLTEAGLRGLEKLMSFLRAWGIPDQWAWAGQPPPRYPGGSVRRRWPDRSGHAYHAGWPSNDHGDPGAIAAPWTLVGKTAPATPDLPADNEGFTTEHVKTVQRLINEIGAWGVLDVDGSLGPLTKTAVRDAQTDLGLTVDGLPGPTTAAALEDTMSKIDELPTSTASAVWSRIMDRPGTTPARADTILRYAAHRSQVDALAEQLATLAGRVEALTEAAGQTGTPDLAAVETAAARGAERVLAGYRLTLERAETETEEDA